jgi:NADH pyrophosphatase NudC (nudix superfamily)
MHCYFCDALLQQIGDVATSSKKSEIAVAYACPHCGKRYQAQWTPTAIFAYTPGQEGTLLRLTQCSRCQQLYRSESRHFCQIT